jgi:hypothetical protein
MPPQSRQRAIASLAIVPAQNQIQTFSLSIHKRYGKKKNQKKVQSSSQIS